MTTSKNQLPLIYSLLFTLFSLLVHGYSFGTGDQSIHIPLIYKVQDLNLYQNDSIFNVGQQNLSLFYLLISTTLNTFSVNLDGYLFALYLINSIFYYLIVYKIGRKFLNNNIQIIIFGLFFILPFHIAGSAVQSIEISLVPRGIAFTASLWAFYYMLTQKVKLFYLLSFAVFIIHPISFIYLFVVSIFYAGLRLLNIKSVVLILLVLFCLSIVLLNFYGNISSDWINILWLRNDYAFFNLWRFKAWLNLAIISIPLLYYIFVRKNKDKRIYNVAIAVFLGCAFLFLVQLTYTVLFPNIFIIKLQLSRIFIYCYFISALILSSLIHLKYQKPILIVIIFLILVNFSKIQNGFIIGQNSNWIDVQKWANTNTQKSCIFLTPFYNQGFRVYSQRPIVSEYKDGTLSFYSKQFALDWYIRFVDIKEWEKLTVDQIKILQSKYNFSYLVSASSLELPFEVKYKNPDYQIYKIPVTYGNCN